LAVVFFCTKAAKFDLLFLGLFNRNLASQGQQAMLFLPLKNLFTDFMSIKTAWRKVSVNFWRLPEVGRACWHLDVKLPATLSIADVMDFEIISLGTKVKLLFKS